MSLQPQTNIVTRTVAGETLLVPVQGRLADLQRIFALNEVGRFVWARLDGQTSIEALGEAVSREFEVASKQARLQVHSFIEALREHGLVKETL